MIWNGTDPLEPDHEVAYRRWPTERVRIVGVNDKGWGYWTVSAIPISGGAASHHTRTGAWGEPGACRHDLILLQKEPDHE